MRIDLNLWQRLLLLAGAVVIGAIAIYQINSDGFDGVSWILPLVVALALAVLATARNTQSKKIISSDRAPLKGHSGKKLSLKPIDLNDEETLKLALKNAASAVTHLIPKRTTTFWNLDQPPEQTRDPRAVSSDVSIRSAIFGYVVLSAACNRVSANYASWPSFASATSLLMAMIETAWWSRHGGRPADLGTIDPRHLQPSLPNLAASGYMLEVLGAMHSGKEFPFASLQAFLEQDISLSPEKLDAKYGPVTRTLLAQMVGASR